ncbi:MAG: hypothetical protein FJ311_04895 [Rhodospirillales bacterium]|nr:hypothetical protein [Rhodospirillales bacterium]
MTDTQVTLAGRRIVEVRSMSVRELEAEGWPPDETVPALVLDNGAILFPSRDEEGNGPGALFGATALKQGFRVLAPRHT